MLLYAPNWLFFTPGVALMILGLAVVFWLLPGPQPLGPHVTIDIHTMIFGVIFTLLGAQIISIGCFAKLFSYAERFDLGERSLQRLLRQVKLEHGLLLGAALALAGFGGDVWVFAQWARNDFGHLDLVRQTLFWSLWFFLGVQIIFSSFFLSMLGISRGTYIGDYEKR